MLYCYLFTEKESNLATFYCMLWFHVNRQYISLGTISLSIPNLVARSII